MTRRLQIEIRSVAALLLRPHFNHERNLSLGIHKALLVNSMAMAMVNWFGACLRREVVTRGEEASDWARIGNPQRRTRRLNSDGSLTNFGRGFSGGQKSHSSHSMISATYQWLTPADRLFVSGCIFG